MLIKTIISPRPNCKTCNIPMNEWNPFAEEHEHIECAADRISNHMINIIKKQFENIRHNDI